MKLSLGKTNHRQVCSMLKLIYRNPGINRKQLGEALCIDRAMVTHIYNYLVEQGWLIEQESAMKRLPLVLNYNKIIAAGVELQPEYQVLVISNLKGDILFEKKFRDTIKNPFDFIKNRVIPILEESKYAVFALGIAIPGIIISDENKILRSVPFELTSTITIDNTISVCGKDIPVFIDNDVRCWGWGKVSFDKENGPFLVMRQHFIENQEDSTQFSRIAGGSAFFQNSKPSTGAHGCAGELPGIFRLNDYKSLHVSEDCRKVMMTNREYMLKYLNNMALCISYFSNTFDVSKTFVSGFENIDVDYLQKKTMEYISEYQFYPELQNMDIIFCDNNPYEVALGACGFVFDTLIVKPCESESVVSLLFPKKSD